MGSFVIKQVQVKELGTCYYFDVYAPSRLVLATSQLYTSLAVCKKGARTVVRDAREAGIDDMTDPTRQSVGYPRFELFREGENFRFRLRTQTKDRVLTSQYYATAELCTKAIHMVKRLVEDPLFYLLEGHELSELLNVNIDRDEETVEEPGDSVDMELLIERPLKWDSAPSEPAPPSDEDAEGEALSYGM